MASNRKPRRKYMPGHTLVSPMAFGLSREASRDLAMRDRLSIGAVLSGSGSRDDLACVEMIVVTAIHMVRGALAKPAGHQIEAEPLREMLERLEAVAAPAVHSIVQHHAATGRMVCSDTERTALADLANIAEELLGALPRRLIADGYRRAIECPVIALEIDMNPIEYSEAMA